MLGEPAAALPNPCGCGRHRQHRPVNTLLCYGTCPIERHPQPSFYGASRRVIASITSSGEDLLGPQKESNEGVPSRKDDMLRCLNNDSMNERLFRWAIVRRLNPGSSAI